MLALTSDRMFTPLEEVRDAAIIVDDGKIIACGSRQALEIPSSARVVDLGDSILAPGYIDIHTHGASGHDCMQPDMDGFRRMSRHLAKHGITSFVPTTVTASDDDTLRAIEFLVPCCSPEFVKGSDGPSAEPLGIHLEGPFLSPARGGVHPPMLLGEPSVERLRSYLQSAKGKLTMLTMAVELPGADEFITQAVAAGVRVSIGHTNASTDEAYAGIAAGASHATHTFNAMRRIDHRDPGVTAVVLHDPRVMADIIVDGLHVAPIMVDLFYRCKGVHRTVLISDATSATGMPDGSYRLGSFMVEVRGLECSSHGKLAGSVLNLDQAVRNMMRFTGCSLRQAVQMATLNPARAIGISSRKGALQPGADADIIALSPTGEVRATMVQGRGLESLAFAK